MRVIEYVLAAFVAVITLTIAVGTVGLAVKWFSRIEDVADLVPFGLSCTLTPLVVVAGAIICMAILNSEGEVSDASD